MQTPVTRPAAAHQESLGTPFSSFSFFSLREFSCRGLMSFMIVQSCFKKRRVPVIPLQIDTRSDPFHRRELPSSQADGSCRYTLSLQRSSAPYSPRRSPGRSVPCIRPKQHCHLESRVSSAIRDADVCPSSKKNLRSFEMAEYTSLKKR
jgi:hypothetical protein